MENKMKILGKIAVPTAGILLIAGIWHFMGISDEKIIGVIPGYDSSEFERIQPGLAAEAEKLGYHVIAKIPEEMTVQAQREAMGELVKEGADCILVEAVAEGGFQDVLDECSICKIPVLAYNSRINSQDIYAEVLPYSIESAAEAMLSVMAEDTDASGQFGVLSSTSQDYLREAATREMLTRIEAGMYPALRFTGSGFVKEQEELILEKADQMEKKYPDLEYLVCYSTVDAQGISDYMEKNNSSWKLICEGSLDELKPFASERTVVLTYDYYRYGKFLANLAAEAIDSDQAPTSGDRFGWEDDREYIFTPKWEWGRDDSETSSNAGTPDFCSITMQEAPEVMRWEDGEWK